MPAANKKPASAAVAVQQQDGPVLDEGQALEEPAVALPAAEPRAREPIPGEGLGRIAYDAYCIAVGGVSVGGDSLPAWDEVKPNVAAAWCASAQAVITATWEGKKP